MQSGNLPAGHQTFSLDDFNLSDADRAGMCEGLTDRQTFMANQWMNIHVELNKGNFKALHEYCDTENFTYDNPNRPDLGSFAEWSESPEGLYNTFPPCVYRMMKVWGSGENEICTLNHHYGKQEKLPYMGVQAKGQEINVMWFSWLKFEGDKLVHIYSISDVLTMFMDIGIIEAPQPVDPYK
ncbi:MAG: ester cyclase [Spongiibacteraceae bacterium]